MAGSSHGDKAEKPAMAVFKSGVHVASTKASHEALENVVSVRGCDGVFAPILLVFVVHLEAEQRPLERLE